MNLYSDFEILDINLRQLVIASDRKKITLEIKRHVEAAARELSLERFGNFESELYQKIFSYLHGNNIAEKTGGVLAIKELIECTSAAAETKVIKFANTLASLLKSNTDFELIELIAETFGHMARNSPISHVDFVECEISRALEWLRGEQAHRKFAACIVLQQLAENAPTIFFTRIKEFFDLIWGSLWDSRDRIRFAASQALSACLSVLSQRTYHLEWYCYIYNNVHEGLKKATAESIHGSLLVVCEMLKHTGDFMVPRFKEISQAIMQFKDHKSRIVRAAIAQLLPALALFCPDAFALRHLSEAIEVLTKCSKTPELRAQALISTGQLCLALKDHLNERADDLINIVCDSLLQSSTTTISPQAMQLIRQMNINSSTTTTTANTANNNSSISALSSTSSSSMIVMNNNSSPFSISTLLQSKSSNAQDIAVTNEILKESLKCISNIVQSLGPQIHIKIPLLLELMFASGITPYLIDTLSIVVKYVPSKLHVIQEKLLVETTKILGGYSKLKILRPDHLYSWGRQGTRSMVNTKYHILKVYHQKSPLSLPSLMNLNSNMMISRHLITGQLPPAAYPQPTGIRYGGYGGGYNSVSPPLLSAGGYMMEESETTTTPQQTTAISIIAQSIQKGLLMMGINTCNTFTINDSSTYSSTNKAAVAVKDPSSVVLSLKTLGSLTLSSSNILPLLISSVLPYFDSTDYTIRREAAVTCAHMLSLAMIKSNLLSQDQDPPPSSSHMSTEQNPMYYSYGTGQYKTSRSASVSSNYAATISERRHSSFSTTDRIAMNTYYQYAAPKPMRMDSSASMTMMEDILMNNTTPGVSGTSQTPRYSREPTGRSNSVGSVDVPTPAVDRLGGVTPALVFSTKRFIDQKSNIYTRGPAAIVIDSIVIKLLQIIVSDPHEDVRKASLRCILDAPIFDAYLSRKYHIDSLLFLLADDLFDIRMDTLTILGRLAFINPALVLPPLRVLLIRLISEMTNSADNRLKEESILMICRFLNSASLQVPVKSYVGTLIKVLPLNADIRLVTASLACVGEICKVMKQDMYPYFDDLLPIIVKHMQDSSSRKKQEIAISTLGLLVGATGRAVEPYLRYPQLLPKALDLLFKSSVNTPWTLRMETLRCIGILGALEPQKYALIINYLQSIKEKNLAEKSNIEEDSYHMKRNTSASILGGHVGGGVPGGQLGIEHNIYLKNELRERADSQNIADLLTNTTAGSFITTTSSSGSGAYGRKPKSGSELEEELIKCDVLLDDDNSDQPAHYFMYSQCVMRSLSALKNEESKRRTPHHEDYYPRMAITGLMKMLQERTLGAHHSAVAQAIMVIFKSLGMKSVPYLEDIVPYLLHLMRVCGPGLRESLLQQFSFLVSIVQYHITIYLPAIFDIIHDFWYDHLEQILFLVEEIAVTAATQFGSYFTVILPLLLSSISAPKNMTTASLKHMLMTSSSNVSYSFKNLEQVLSCCNALRGILIPHLHLVIPVFCKLMVQLQEIGSDTLHWQILTVRTIRKICTTPKGYASISDESNVITSRLIHCLTKTITIYIQYQHALILSSSSASNSTTTMNNTNSSYHMTMNSNSLLNSIFAECIHTICCIGYQVGPKFIIFDSLIISTIENQGLNISEYLELSRMLHTGMLSEYDYFDREIYRDHILDDSEIATKIGLNSSKVESDMVGIGSYYISGQNTRNHGIDDTLTTDSTDATLGYMNHHPSRRSSHTNIHPNSNQKLTFNQQQLARAWDVTQRSTAADWIEWFRRLKVELIRESPNPVLRACSGLCQVYPPLANELFHAAFVSCWYELNMQYQESLVKSLQIAFRSSTIPPESLQTLLNLAEFMEHDVEALPISLSILAELAQKGHAYAKALHYRELEFQSSPATCFESLITINKKLDQYDAAVGILTVVENLKKQYPHLENEYNVHESWLAKLGHWNEAMIKYEKRLEKDPRDGEAIAGKLKCLDALGRWEEAINLCNESLEFLKYGGIGSSNSIPTHISSSISFSIDTEHYAAKLNGGLNQRYPKYDSRLSNTSSSSSRTMMYQQRLFTKAAVIGARAAWSLNEWDLMENFVIQLPDDNIDACFMSGVLAIHRENYQEASRLIEQTRRHLDSSITALLAESYGRAYVPLIMVQQCSEMEEIAEFKVLIREAGLDEWRQQSDHGPPTLKRDSSLTQSTTGSMGYYPSDNTYTMNTNITTTTGTSGYPRANFGSMSPGSSHVHRITQQSTPVSPRSRSNMKLANFTVEDSTSAISNEQSQQFTLQMEARRRKILLVEKWRRRLRGCCSSGRAAIPVWKYLLNGRRMILNEREDLDTWLDFATLCRKGGNTALAERVLQMTQRMSNMYNFSHASDATSEEMDRRIKFAMLKQQWAVSDKRTALIGLENLIQQSYSLPSITASGHGMRLDGHRFDIIRTPGGGSSNGPIPQVPRYLGLPTSPPLPNHPSTMDGSRYLAEHGHITHHTNPGDVAVHLECLLMLGEWKISILGPDDRIDPITRREVLALYRAATVIDSRCYQAWHQWGLANIRAIEEARNYASTSMHGLSTSSHSGSMYNPSGSGSLQRGSSNKGSLPVYTAPTSSGGTSSRSPIKSRYRASSVAHVAHEILIPYAVNAIDGLMRALTLGTKRWSSTVTEDMLNIMSLWFRYGHIPDIADALEQRLNTVHIDTWLGVLPQLIARIDHPGKAARTLLHTLLIRLGEKHAQALVYPLSVALKSPREERKQAAESLMNSLKQHSKILIEQALLVSHELIRVAILWQEVWHEGLEEASRLYFGEGNIQGMLDTLIPLHLMIQQGPMTHRETSFINTYGNELKDAWQCITGYINIMKEKNKPLPGNVLPIRRVDSQHSPEQSMIHQAWDFYYNVFKRINSELGQITSLELQYVSPALLNCRNLDLGVPGTYTVSGDAVRITHVAPVVGIIRSKQRPRKIRIYGHNGEEFVFLLKGHEDLRQDERAMQLFGLVNALLQHDSRTSGESHDLNIQRYAVIPLSPTAGLISWVPNSDTLHDLIRDFRDTRKIMLNLEHKIMMQMAPNNTYDLLTHPQKLEVFEHALADTDGDDLAKILWLKSETSETWLHRRTNYTRSLAVMSMVGYVLGLGDRHPSNLMLDRKSGKVLHIDFGDCFEVAMQREKFPEKVPFRLTRMLVKAMEVSGIEGSYRLTCEKVMTVLRENRDSLIAVLEAFVHDPLLSWRLLNTLERENPESVRKNKESVAVSAATSLAGSAVYIPDIHIHHPNTTNTTNNTNTITLNPTINSISSQHTNQVTNELHTHNSHIHIHGTGNSTTSSSSSLSSSSQLNAIEQKPGPLFKYEHTANLQHMATTALETLVEVDDEGQDSLSIDKSRRNTFDTTDNNITKSSTVMTSSMLLDAMNPPADTIYVTNSPPPLSEAIVNQTSTDSMDSVTGSSTITTITTTVPSSEVKKSGLGQNTNNISTTTVTGSTTTNTNNISNTLEQQKLMMNTTSTITTTTTTVDKRDELLNTTVAITVPMTASYKPNLHLEMMALSNSQVSNIAAGGGLSSLRHRSLRSLSMAEKIYGSLQLQPELDTQIQANTTKNTTNTTNPTTTTGLEVNTTINNNNNANNMLYESEVDELQEELKEKAVRVIRRVRDKLTGLDFFPNTTLPLPNTPINTIHNKNKSLDVQEQVDKLILQATSNELLCQGFFGWCPFW